MEAWPYFSLATFDLLPVADGMNLKAPVDGLLEELWVMAYTAIGDSHLRGAYESKVARCLHMFKGLDGTGCSQSQKKNRRTFGKGCLVYECSQILVKK
jgi:hypothetical protein